jgi:uncharacterized protein YjbJ (UPF0337 family)
MGNRRGAAERMGFKAGDAQMADNKDLNTRGTENRIEGTAKEVEGKVRGTIGDATDNESEQLKGKAKELEGKVQKNFGKAEQKVDE